MESSPTPNPQAAEKAALRARARVSRAGVGAHASARGAESVASHLLALPEIGAARVVLAYGATPEEIDPGPAVSALRERGVVTVFPRIEEAGVLGIHEVLDDAEFVTGVFGLREPSADAPRIELERIDLVIVPGVAFDERGYRLGYGGGYYDRLLPRLRPDCVRIGLAFEEQVFEAVPCDDHDQPVQVLVTPERVLRFAE
jgi:5-formyltetrahydrofolate cyclo-ligase